jgi:uridine monophosphate synthetase
MNSAIEVYKELTNDLKFDCWADVPTAATPIVAILFHETGIPMISPRAEEKQYGTKNQIDGSFKEGQVALLVDDLITRADSKIQIISILEENNLKINDVVVLIDREQGGVQELGIRGYACHVAFGLRELLDFYLHSGKINHSDFDRTISYLALSSRGLL